MTKDHNDQEKDFSGYDDAELQELIDGAETDNEASAAYIKNIQRSHRDEAAEEAADDEPVYNEDANYSDYPEDEPYSMPVKLPYGMVGKILWPAITLASIAAMLIIFFQVLGALGSYQAKIYLLVGGVAFGILSQTFVITGIRDFGNRKADPLHRVSILPYILNAIIWIPIGGYALYSAVRSWFAYYQSALELSGYLPVSAELLAFYNAIPAFVLAVFAMFQAVIFVLLCKELRK